MPKEVQDDDGIFAMCSSCKNMFKLLSFKTKITSYSIKLHVTNDRHKCLGTYYYQTLSTLGYLNESSCSQIINFPIHRPIQQQIGYLLK